MIASARRMVRKPKPEVEWDGSYYKVKSAKVAIPDLKAMDRFSAIQWLIANTYPRGYSKPNPLAGIGGAISLSTQ